MGKDYGWFWLNEEDPVLFIADSRSRFMSPESVVIIKLNKGLKEGRKIAVYAPHCFIDAPQNAPSEKDMLEDIISNEKGLPITLGINRGVVVYKEGTSPEEQIMIGYLAKENLRDSGRFTIWAQNQRIIKPSKLRTYISSSILGNRADRIDLSNIERLAKYDAFTSGLK